MDDGSQFIDERLVETPTLLRRRGRGGFLRGPIPLLGIRLANSLPGRAGQVYLLIWYVAGLKGSKESLPITPSQSAKFGLADRTVRRGLGALESAGLIRVDRRQGRSPRVDVLVPS